MPNRLANESSPYLRQHANNPVDWYPWGDEAFAKAKAEGKPVFLSIGYSSCHWCHVMEHESFEDQGVADILNQFFVSVKVDREERPDIDEAYMLAVQLSTGGGGWPMSVFLTPARKPFFAGTYFPREDRGQHPGFKTILKQLAAGWRAKRADFEKAGEEFGAAIRSAIGGGTPKTFTTLTPELLNQAIAKLASEYDAENAGFGTAPKFPPHSALELLMAVGIADPDENRQQEALGMALETLQLMALGGIHDQVGGGFHRYSTDARWLLPHFEKMLYDNALLLASYARGERLAEMAIPALVPLFKRAKDGIVGWLQREMLLPGGLYASAIDADSEGEEGKFYVWEEAEVRAVLGDRAQAFCDAFGFRPEGNFKDEATKQLTGANIPHLADEDGTRFTQDLNALRMRRDRRVRPGTDHKAIVGWNGLLIVGLVEAGQTEAAITCARTLLQAEKSHGRLPHQMTDGVTQGEAFLEDYAALVNGLLALGMVEDAKRLADEMVAKFWDESGGGFFSTSDRHEALFGRGKPATDQPIPSANSLALRALIALGDRDRATKGLTAFVGWMEKAPQATEGLLLATHELFGEVPPPPVPKTEAAKPKQVVARLDPKEWKAGPDGWASGEVVIDVPEGVHLNDSDPPARWLTPTQVAIAPLKAEVTYPKGENSEYRGVVRIPVRVQLPSGSKGEEFEVRLKYQPCTESECLAPVEDSFTGVALK